MICVSVFGYNFVLGLSGQSMELARMVAFRFICFCLSHRIIHDPSHSQSLSVPLSLFLSFFLFVSLSLRVAHSLAPSLLLLHMQQSTKIDAPTITHTLYVSKIQIDMEHRLFVVSGGPVTVTSLEENILYRVL